MKKRQIAVIRWMAFSGVGLFAFLYVFYYNTFSKMSLLCILPAFYTIISFFFLSAWGDRLFDHITGILFWGFLSLKTVVMPVLMVMSGDQITISSNMNQAIMLFSYEVTIETLMLSFWMFQKRGMGIKNSSEVVVTYSYKYLMIALAVLAILCLVLAPSAVLYYRTIFGITDYEYTGFDSRRITMLYATNFASKFGLVTFRYVMNVVRVIFPALLIVECKKRRKSRRFCASIAMVSTFMFNFLIVDDTLATSLFNSLIIAIFYNRIFDNSMKKLISTFAVVALFVAAFFALRFSFEESRISLAARICASLQAYFGGLNNIAAGLNMNVSSLEMKFKYAIYEFLRGIPYATTIFRLDNTNIATLFNSTNGYVGQIVPTITSSALYFGYLLSPIYTVFFLFLSFRAGLRYENDYRPLNMLSDIVICVYAIMGTSVYSPEITWTFVICVGIVIKILAFFFER